MHLDKVVNFPFTKYKNRVNSMLLVLALFLVTVSSNPCNARPEFVADTPPQGQSVSTVTGATFQLTVFAQASISTEK